MCREKWLGVLREIWLSATQFYNYTYLRRIFIIIHLWTAGLTILGASAKLQKATIVSSCLSFCPSVRLHETTWSSLDRFSWNLVFVEFSKICREKFKFNENLTIITGVLREDLRTFMIISRWIPPRMRSVSDKSCRESKMTHFVFFTKILLVVI